MPRVSATRLTATCRSCAGGCCALATLAPVSANATDSNVIVSKPARTPIGFNLFSSIYSASPAELIQLGDDGGDTRTVFEIFLEQFGFDNALRIENKNDRPRHSVSEVTWRVLRVTQIIEIDDLGFRIREQRISQL